jgi:hypothetical protein
MSSYFYSGQIRRFLSQFIRVLSNFEIALGNRTGTKTLLRVPIYYGDSSRQVSSIIAKNSENNLASVPAMAVYISALKYDRSRVQEPQHISKMQIRQRAYDPVTGEFTEQQGDALTVERLMPVPYLLSLRVDIWCSNTDQKLQLIEQIGVIFNPSIELQNSDSYVDWTSLSYITLTDLNYSSRSVPVGTEDPIDVATLSFDLPIWLSAPAKVKRQGVIQKIFASIYNDNDIDYDNNIFDIESSVRISQQIFTPIDLNVLYLGNTLKLYASKNAVQFNDGTVPGLVEADWRLAIQNFGELANLSGEILSNGISQVRLDNNGVLIVGTVAYHPTDNSLLIFNVDIDTLPVNTITPVNAIIDPYNLKVTPALINPAIGDRYLILNPIGSYFNDDGDPLTIDGPILWNRANQPELIANTNDIIEWDGNRWAVVFDSINVNSIQYVTNLTTGTQYKWINQEWTRSVEGLYGVGAWSFVPNT